MIDLQQSTSHLIQAAVRTRDGGTWLADVVYRDRGGIAALFPTVHGRTRSSGQALVHAIEASGKTQWAQVRSLIVHSETVHAGQVHWTLARKNLELVVMLFV